MNILLTTVIFCLLTKILPGMKSFYGIYFKVLDNHSCSLDDLETNKPEIESEMHCLHLCALNEECRSFFFHPGDRMCYLCNKKYTDVNMLRNSTGTKYYRPLASSCTEGQIISNRQGGAFNVEIDPDGFKSEFDKITVPCVEEQGKAVIVMHHDKEERTRVKGYEDPGSYRVDLTYDIGLETILHLVNTLSACKQYIKYECHSALIIGASKIYASWINRSNMTSSYFIGDGSSTYYCECAGLDDCTVAFGCQCNHNDRIWRSDEGYVTNKEDLPILALKAGDTGDSGEEVYHTIGSLMCW